MPAALPERPGVDRTGELLATIETGLPRGSGDIDVGGGYVWLNTPYQVLVAQIDPETNMLVRRYIGKLGGEVIRYGSGSLWVGGPTIRRISPPKLAETERRIANLGNAKPGQVGVKIFTLSRRSARLRNVRVGST